MSLGQRLGRGIAWNFVAAAATNGANLVAALLLANILGKRVFGEFAIVQSTIVSVAGIAQVGMGLSANKFIAQYRDADKEKAARMLGLCSLVAISTGVVAALVLLLGSSHIAKNLLDTPSLAGSIALASGVVLFATINGFQVGALAGLERYRDIASVSLAAAVLHVALCGTMGVLYGVDGVIVGLVVSASFRWVLYGTALRRGAASQGIVAARRGVAREADFLFKFALPASLGGVSALAAIWAANALLVRQQNGLADMGLYAAANSLRALLLFLPTIVNSVGTSVINNFANEHQIAEYRAAFWSNLALTFLTLLIGGGTLALFGGTLLSLFGREFIGGHLLLNIMIIGAIVEGTGIAIYQIVQSKARMWMSFCLISIPRDLLLVALAWTLIPSHGAVGLATSYALAAVIGLISVTLITLKIGISYSVTGVEGRRTHIPVRQKL